MLFCHLVTKNPHFQRNAWEFGKCPATNQGFSGMSVRLCSVFQRKEKEYSSARQSARLHEEGKQKCYICKRKSINGDMAHILILEGRVGSMI